MEALALLTNQPNKIKEKNICNMILCYSNIYFVFGMATLHLILCGIVL